MIGNKPSIRLKEIKNRSFILYVAIVPGFPVI